MSKKLIDYIMFGRTGESREDAIRSSRVLKIDWDLLNDASEFHENDMEDLDDED